MNRTDHLPLEAARTSLQSMSQWERFSTARDESMCPRVSWISEHNLRSVSRSNIPNRTPSRPVSVILTPWCREWASRREPAPGAKGFMSAKWEWESFSKIRNLVLKFGTTDSNWTLCTCVCSSKTTKMLLIIFWINARKILIQQLISFARQITPPSISLKSKKTPLFKAHIPWICKKPNSTGL